MRLIDADRLKNLLQNDLEGFETMISEHGKGIAHGTRMALGLTKEQPTIRLESLRSQWIPVTERMPQEHQIVVGWTKDNPFSCYRAEVVTWNGKGWVFIYAQRYVTNVKYWMPLPEPYTADAEENEGVQPAHWEKADIPLPYQVRTVPTPSGTFAHREMYVCSACDGYNDKNTQYCPHCGAKMDKEDPE